MNVCNMRNLPDLSRKNYYNSRFIVVVFNARCVNGVWQSEYFKCDQIHGLIECLKNCL